MQSIPLSLKMSLYLFFLACRTEKEGIYQSPGAHSFRLSGSTPAALLMSMDTLCAGKVLNKEW